MSDLNLLIMRAIDQAAGIMEQVAKELLPNPPSREEIKSRLQGVLDAPTMGMAQQLQAQFEQDFPGVFEQEQRLQLQESVKGG